jgi:spore coat protein JB
LWLYALSKGGIILSDNSLELKKQLAAIHMMIEDLNLYLNTHPYDQEALEARNVYVKSYHELHEQYNQCYGMLKQDDISSYPWQWIDEPWPWECEANFKL